MLLKHNGERHTRRHTFTVCVQTRHVGLVHLKEQPAAAEAPHAAVTAPFCASLSPTAASSTFPPILQRMKMRCPPAVKPSVWSEARSPASRRQFTKYPQGTTSREVVKVFFFFFSFFFTFSAQFNTKQRWSSRCLEQTLKTPCA